MIDRIFELYIKYALEGLKPTDSRILHASLWGRVSCCLTDMETGQRRGGICPHHMGIKVQRDELPAL